ncbi:MAG: SufD family Fe-S cluster assembly protein [Anaerolineales bacterium]|nr:SufD family Fe-S cluster assembly protein [Anaerolineales bacterium]
MTGKQSGHTELIPLDGIQAMDADSLAEVGVFLDPSKRSATYVLRNNHLLSLQSEEEGLELLSISEALQKYPSLLEKYYFSAVPANTNDITRKAAALETPEGFFLRVREGAKVELPCQAGLYIQESGLSQLVHNVIILEDNAELQLITGCVSHQQVLKGVHHAITEQYIGRNASLTSNMVHSWGPEVTVRPHAGTVVDEDGIFVNNYISLRPAGDIISNPNTWLNGKGAAARYQTVILGSERSKIVSGGNVYLNAEGTSAELAHRGVSTGGVLLQQGLLVGNAPCRGHVDCAGMLLDTDGEGYVESTPGIRALHPLAILSHEASIGKISPEQVEYLQSRGIEEREAISMIIRGFLDADIEGLGQELDARIGEIAELAGHGE